MYFTFTSIFPENYLDSFLLRIHYVCLLPSFYTHHLQMGPSARQQTLRVLQAACSGRLSLGGILQNRLLHLIEITWPLMQQSL